MTSQADELFADVYDQYDAFYGTTIRIQRGSTLGPEITAVADPDDGNKSSEGIPGTRQINVPRTFEIRVEDYTVGGEQVKPHEGDRIKETIDGVECTFELMRFGNLPAYEELDTDRVYWLVRTKQVASG